MCYFFLLVINFYSILVKQTLLLFFCRLVDSRDIVELQLKQLDCEVTIRKKEAILQQSSPARVAMIHGHPSPGVPPVTPASTLTPTPAPPSPTPSASPPAVKSTKLSHPPLKCPMAGTFYRSPAPGEPPFVKVDFIFCMI